MAKETLHIGIVGCGLMALRHLKALEQMSTVNVIAFCDVIREKAALLARKYKGSVYTDATRMIREQTLDAVYLLLPPFAHGSIEMAAVERRIPFFVDKPIGSDLGLCREIAAAVEEANLITSVGYHNRYRRTVQHAKKIFETDPPILAYGGWITGIPLAPEHLRDRSWTLQKSKTGGRLAESGSHTIDLLRHLIGEVEEIFAFGTPPRTFNREVPDCYDLFDTELVSLRFKSGALGTVFTTIATQAGIDVSLNIYARQHKARFEGWEHALFVIKTDRHGDRTSFEMVPEPPSWEDWDFWRRHKQLHRHEIEEGPDVFLLENLAFIHAVSTGDPSLIKTDYQDALKTSEITLGIQECIAHGNALDL
jgi:predicted dehydrogenase